MLAAAFAGIAERMSAAMGGPYHTSVVHSETAPVFDDGGSIVTPGTPIARDCLCQVDVATQAMRQADGFVDTDVRLLVLTTSLEGPLLVGQRVEVTAGPGAGTYSVLSAVRDPLGVAWDCRAKRSGT